MYQTGSPPTGTHRRTATRPSLRSPLLWAVLLVAVLAGSSAASVANASHPTRSANAGGPCGPATALRTGTGIVCVHGDDGAFLAAGTAVSVDGITPLPIPCNGDGSSGNRLAIYYVYFVGHANRITTVRPQIRAAVEAANDVVYRSARQTGGKRWLRVLTDSRCRPIVRALRLPRSAASSFATTIDAAKAAGLNATNRKYVLFADAAAMCGIATLRFDSQPSRMNVNNIGPSWARVDRVCWSGLASAHEIFHMLGAVQTDAPHFDGTGHCTDDRDLMCYQNVGGKLVRIRCAASADDGRLDCGKDDYFNTAPAAGSYLAKHWNTAWSSFLYRGGPARPALPGRVGSPIAPMITLGSAQLRWSAPANSRVTGYDVMKDGAVVWHGTATHWDETNAAPGLGAYQIRAVNESGAGPWSTAIVAVLPAPAAPQNVIATSATSVAWTYGSDLVAGFQLYGVSDDGTTHYISAWLPTARSAVDYTWSRNRTWHRYQVCAVNLTGSACADQTN
jgi:hypothetical protein